MTKQKCHELSFLRSYFFRFLFILWTALISISGCPLLALPGKLGYRCSWIVARTWSFGTFFLLKLICNINYRVENPERLKTDHPKIYAIKHQSIWETAFAIYGIKEPCLILKQELVNIPVYGWYFRKMRMIWIKRENSSESMKKISKISAEVLKEGRSIVIFPEGTRIDYGKIADCKAGAYLIYKMAKNCCPVALNSGKYWPKHGKMSSGEIVVAPQSDINDLNLKKEDFLQLINEKINILNHIDN